MAFSFMIGDNLLINSGNMRKGLLSKGTFIYYVSTCRGGGVVRKCQFLLILSTKNMLGGEGEGGPQIPEM